MATRGRRDNKGYRGRGSSHSSREHDSAETVDVSSPIMQVFLGHRQQLDTRHDKYERIVKLSRDVTICSKRAIFLLHRATGPDKETTMDEAKKKIKDIQVDKFQMIAEELYLEDPYQFTRAYSPGLQEYIEAVSFCQYLEDGSLITLAEIQKDLIFARKEEKDSPENETKQTETTLKVLVTPLDYVLGLADLTGELMRLAITCIGAGNIDLPFIVCRFMRQMHDGFASLGNVNRELPRKLSVLKQSLRKVETACYTIQVRGSEFPKSVLLNLINISESESDNVNSNYAL